ncbi:MAG: VacB/RNase II family 3'-5' exoribonuclease [Firmicutes bacterium]|nr:VacB/RNase II family 3'-5' exoribonuclease [Bacillota bacterium]
MLRSRYGRGIGIKINKKERKKKTGGGYAASRYGKKGRRRRKGTLTGTFQGTRRGYAFLIPDSREEADIFIPANKTGKAAEGDRVSVKILSGGSGKNRKGEVISVIRTAEAKMIDREKFPSRVMKELRNLPGEEEIASIALREGRADLRDEPVVTVDPEDARDMDDGISLEVRDVGGYRLGVHIADVSYYVREGSALHREALKRGTSVYLTDRVIHMLPPLLSQELCSLQENKDRLALSVIMEIDVRGRVERCDIIPSLVKVKRKLSYEQAEEMLSAAGKPTEIGMMLKKMDELASLLERNRLRNGALFLNLPETKITVDDEGKPLSIERKFPGRAESIIEEFMLLANVSVSERFAVKDQPFIYRVHPPPTEEKMAVFRNILSLMNVRISGDLRKIKPRAIQSVLDNVRGTSLERTVNYLLLRSLPHAYYSVDNERHFGLAMKKYTHFTSPIRRFPDLQIHALIKDQLAGNMDGGKVAFLKKQLPGRAEHASYMERKAMEAERESVQHKKVEYMEGKEGESFPGIICGVTSFGLFVELENTVEGLVLLESLRDDYYHYHEEMMAVIGRRTRKKYRLGDPVNVEVSRVDLQKKVVYFHLLSR